MYFTQAELLALLQVSIKITVINKKMPWELLQQEAYQFFHFGISFGELVQMKKIKVCESDILAILSSMAFIKKKYASGYLAMLMKCDDELDSKELKIWKTINEKCGFPIISVTEAYDFWVDNFDNFNRYYNAI